MIDDHNWATVEEEYATNSVFIDVSFNNKLYYKQTRHICGTCKTTKIKRFSSATSLMPYSVIYGYGYDFDAKYVSCKDAKLKYLLL